MSIVYNQLQRHDMQSGIGPRISVIVAVYNAEKYLEQCISSILSQSYGNFELIIIDGLSKDKSTSIIESYGTKVNYWVSEPDQGIYDAWNKGIAVATGSWFTFVGADDVLYEYAFESYINHILLHQNSHRLDFLSSYIELVTEELAPIRTIGSMWKWQEFKINMTTGHVGCFHARSLFETYGYFDSTYKISGDYELLLRAKENLKADFVPVATVRMRTGGVSASQLKKAIDETYRAKAKNNILPLWKARTLAVVDKVRIKFNI
ncbi:glycosyltransferase family 2 protein [Spirosoma pollinicola]|nr:glycosyltransferase family 2 protein [Spirosoma pollinicola]